MPAPRGMICVKSLIRFVRNAPRLVASMTGLVRSAKLPSSGLLPSRASWKRSEAGSRIPVLGMVASEWGRNVGFGVRLFAVDTASDAILGPHTLLYWLELCASVSYCQASNHFRLRLGGPSLSSLPTPSWNVGGFSPRTRLRLALFGDRRVRVPPWGGCRIEGGLAAGR